MTWCTVSFHENSLQRFNGTAAKSRNQRSLLIIWRQFYPRRCRVALGPESLETRGGPLFQSVYPPARPVASPPQIQVGFGIYKAEPSRTYSLLQCRAVT